MNRNTSRVIHKEVLIKEKILLISLCLLAILVIGGTYLVYAHNMNKQATSALKGVFKKSNAASATNSPDLSTESSSDQSSWKFYSSPHIGLQIEYPSFLTAHEVSQEKSGNPLSENDLASGIVPFTTTLSFYKNDANSNGPLNPECSCNFIGFSVNQWFSPITVPDYVDAPKSTRQIDGETAQFTDLLNPHPERLHYSEGQLPTYDQYATIQHGEIYYLFHMDYYPRPDETDTNHNPNLSALFTRMLGSVKFLN